MNLGKVIFAFVVMLAATLNAGFFVGDLGDPTVHHVSGLFAAVVVNMVATLMKLGDRTQFGATHLATSLVADLQLVAAVVCWVYAAQFSPDGLTRGMTAVVVSLSGGALLANVASVTLLVVETVRYKRP
ncbi:hypothetical protein GCM10009557_33540 [Virgisporangium ochraceum]|uniref:Uncharacterized protein n=1 Tax=Virgisporangium ochraceum TaxID=65505 RepID=A0A8J4EHX8_9ACTN|nr:DUF6394 family protein [Virgisporangium ochraceum]GIJ75459.1 hypothetical protein Voc01_103760 [Virgisporangium ochraceum]